MPLLGLIQACFSTSRLRTGTPRNAVYESEWRVPPSGVPERSSQALQLQVTNAEDHCPERPMNPHR